MLDKEQVLNSLNVSRETQEKLSEFHALFEKWNKAINLVAQSTMSDFWMRHILDSAQVYQACQETAGNWVDLGSGGGLPGLVIAILRGDSNGLVHLIESDQRKSAFLVTVSAQLGLKTKIHAERIEEVPCVEADILSARALAALPKLLEFSQLHLKEGGVALLSKGQSWKQEVESAQKEWAFSLEEIPSKTENGAVLLKIGNIVRV